MTLPRRVLCVDTHADIGDLIAAILAASEVVSVRSAGEAIEKTGRETFDLYLLDDFLADGTGLELCAAIHDSHNWALILIMTDTYLLRQKDVQGVGAIGVVYKRDLPHSLLEGLTKIFGNA